MHGAYRFFMVDICFVKLLFEKKFFFENLLLKDYLKLYLEENLMQLDPYEIYAFFRL